MSKRFILILSLFFISSCSSRLIDFTLLSTKQMPLAVSNFDDAPMTPNARGESGQFWFMLYPLHSAPNLKKAIENCMTDGNGDFIVNGVIFEQSFTLFIFSYRRYVVQGSVGNSQAVKEPKKEDEFGWKEEEF